MKPHWWLISSFVQTFMFVVLFLFMARMEERIITRLAAAEAALGDVTSRLDILSKEVKP